LIGMPFVSVCSAAPSSVRRIDTRAARSKLKLADRRCILRDRRPPPFYPRFDMPKKQKRPSVKARQQACAVTPESARADLDAGRFREAMAGFKELLKQAPAGEDRDALRDGLADAYEGRARQLGAKGMHKEALVMWENRAALGTLPLHPDHAVCLLRLGRVAQVIPMLDDVSLKADPETRSLLLGHLAAQILAGTAGIAETLPADDPIRVQATVAEEALDAYCAGNDQALAEALKAIPFRSPYRDLVKILKALSRLDPAARDHRGDWTEEARNEAAKLLDRIDDNSGFARLRDAARLALASEAELAPRLREVGPATRDLVFSLRGWPAERAILWGELQVLGNSPQPKELLRLMFRHRRVLGETWVHERGLRLLLPKPQTGATWWIEVGGKPLRKIDGYLLDAWESEGDSDPWEVVTYWQDYADLVLDAAGDRVEPGSDTALRIALVHRRAETLFQILQRMEPDSDPDSLPEIIAADLESSLEYDPDDRTTYLSLIAYYLRGGKALKDARRILKLAQTRWPNDKAVLTAAMDTAIAGGAFKKAATIAADILAVDPINSGVRERLVEAHLSHARKNLSDQRPDLAMRALALAEDWSRTERTRERLDLVRGLAELLAFDPHGEGRLLAVAERLGNGLAARLILLLEADACGIPGARLLKQLGLAKAPTPDEADLRAFFSRVRAHLDTGAKLPSEVGRELKGPLKQTARLKLDQGEVESICETLRRTDLHDVRLAFAEAALKRWRGEPVFELHAFEARHRGVVPWNIPMRETLRLEQALERARDNGDSRLVHRLIELLSGPSLPFGGPPRGGFGSGFIGDAWDDEDDDIDAPLVDSEMAGRSIALLADMLRTLGPSGFRALIQMPGPVGESLRAMEREIGKDALDMMINALAADLDAADLPFPDPGIFDTGPSPSKRKRNRAKRKRR
jgi:tetratricopeptide (TPR) repeat protein